LSLGGLEVALAKLGGRIVEKHDLGRAEFIYAISFAERPLKRTKKLALFSAAVNGDNSGDALIVDAVQRLLSPQAAEIFPLLETLTDAQIEEVNACDLAVICGTNLYQQDFSCALTPGIIEKIRVPILPLGIGTSAPIGQLPQMRPEGARAVRMIHERCAMGSVRDPISLQFVRGLGISNVELTGCPVLFHALKEPVFKTASTDRLVVAVRARLLHVEEHWGARQQQTLERLCREFHPTLVLQSPYDLPIAEELGARFHVQVLHHPHYSAKPMLDGMFRATRTIGFRLHFGMLTLAYGKPATLIATDTRTSEFCAMMGVPWHGIHSYTDDALINELREPQPGREKFVSQWRQLREAMTAVLKSSGLETALK
jgi:polysaccharide pyruvyl transferase WcaK-like protein